MTNVIYVDVTPYDDWDDPEWKAPAGAGEWMNPWPQAPEITVPDSPVKPPMQCHVAYLSAMVRVSAVIAASELFGKSMETNKGSQKGW